MPRAYWKGFLRLSLVSCPIALYPDPAVTAAEKTRFHLAAHILDTKAAKFNPNTFEDKYEIALKKLVKRKAAGKTIEAPEREQAAEEPTDLMQALKQSLGRRPTVRRSRGSTRRSTARAPNRKARRRAA